MGFDRVAGTQRISGTQCGEDLFVLGVNRVDSWLMGESSSGCDGDLVPHDSQQPVDLAVTGKGRQGQVEGAVRHRACGRSLLAGLLVAGDGQFFDAAKAGGQEEALSLCLCSELHGVPFQGGASLEGVGQLMVGGHPNANTAPSTDDEALGVEHAQGLSDGGSAHTEALSKRQLRNSLVPVQLSRTDQPQQTVICIHKSIIACNSSINVPGQYN